jgi:CubicO group peptidase (beta-lactamase class C family)
MRRIGALVFGMVFASTVALAAMAANCGIPIDIHDGWAVAAPEKEGFDPALICGIGPRLEGWTEADPHGVVVARHGVLVYDDYFAGQDKRWPQQHWDEPLVDMPHDVRTKHDLQSITKSVVGILVGIALNRGLIENIDLPVLSFFPEYADLRDPDKDRITLRDLLTMRSGLRWPYQPYLSMARQMEAAPDPYRFVLQQPLVAAPGINWHYNNGSAELIGGILQKATGRPLDQFSKEALFDPLGIDDWEWGRMAHGEPGASWGLRLRPRDLAKIGQLVLNLGAWHGQQIVSAAWIKEMTTPHIVKQNASSYGYLWWSGRRSVEGHDIDWIGSIGWGGQCLYVLPRLDLIVVVTAGVYNFDGGGSQDLAGDTVLDKFVLPATLGHWRRQGWLMKPTPYLDPIAVLDRRGAICREVLESLPEWFGIPALVENYVATADELPMMACFDPAGEIVGFVSVKTHTVFAAEVYVMGVKRSWHRRGIGRALIEAVVELAIG